MLPPWAVVSGRSPGSPPLAERRQAAVYDAHPGPAGLRGRRRAAACGSWGQGRAAARGSWGRAGAPVAAPAPAALNRVIQPGLAEADAAIWPTAHVNDLRAAAAVGLPHDGPFQSLVHDEHDVVAARVAADEVLMAGMSPSAMSTASANALVRQSAQLRRTWWADCTREVAGLPQDPAQAGRPVPDGRPVRPTGRRPGQPGVPLAVVRQVGHPLRDLRGGRRRQAHSLARVEETLARDSVAIATTNV